MFKGHVTENQKVAKVFHIGNIIYFNGIHMLREGAFSEGVMRGNTVYHPEDAPVITMYLYELFNYWLLNLCLLCLECLFQTTQSYKSIYTYMKYNS